MSNKRPLISINTIHKKFWFCQVKPYNIRVTVSFPPDTDTPGYAQENINKPKETMLIAESAGLFQPEYVAKCLIDDAVVIILSVLTVGMELKLYLLKRSKNPRYRI